jgi:DNA-binding beta-propeller fold protein YncE
MVGKALDGASGVAVSPDGRNVYVASLAGAALAVFDRELGTGALAIKAGQDGCVTEAAIVGCEDGRALLQAAGVAVSPDGASVYVASRGSDAVAILDRDPLTGALNQKVGIAGCVSEDGTMGTCDLGDGLNGATAVAVSPDGRNVYVASFDGDAVASFERDPATGALNQIDCWSEDGSGGDCLDGKALDDPFGVAVSPDGRSVYVASATSGAVAVFERDVVSGQLTQPADATGCISDDGTAGECADGTALAGATSVAVTTDGLNVYVAARDSNALAIFNRDPASGLLNQNGCIDTAGLDCTLGTALGVAFSVAVSADGESVYVAGSLDDAVAVFDRKTSSGELDQKNGPAACVAENGGPCTDGRGLDAVGGVAVSPESKTVYAASFLSDAVAILDRDVPSYDIDGDGETTALVDGLLLLRYLFGLTGAPLVSSAVDLVNCTRCTAAAIEAYIESLQTL